MKILIADTTSEKLREKLEKFGDVAENLNEKESADAIIIRSRTKMDKDMIDSMPKLKLIVRAGVGLDNVDLEYCRGKGIEVRNTASASSLAVAELVFAHMLSLNRHIVKADKSLKNREWLKKELRGMELNGKTMGIVGLGNIGKMIALRAKAFGMDVAAFDPFVTESKDAELVDFDELVRRSDYITLHIPLTPKTKDLINRDVIYQMKDGAVIINTSRGGIVNETDLLEALKSGKLRGACLDVFEKEPPFDSPLLALDNVILTPHIGAQTYENAERIEEVVEEILEKLSAQT